MNISCNKAVHRVKVSFVYLFMKGCIITRSQTNFAKVMFLQVFVCLQVGCLSRGGVCPGESLCLVGVSVRGSLSGRPAPRTVKSLRYVSYWNAFLLSL